MNNLDEKLLGVESVGITGHVRPDGDCAGSTLAVYNYIATYYPEIKVELFLEPIPNIFKFLLNADKINNSNEEDKYFDLFIVCDCGDLGRLGGNAKYFTSAKDTICIDHHISNQSFAKDNYVFPDASSTCELVFELMPEEKITKEIAECLYTGIVHDTGVFQYSCTSAKTMNIGGILMEKGINYSKIVDETFYTKTYNQNKIMGQALLDSELYLDGKCIVSYVTAETMKKFNCIPKHLDGIVSQLRVTKDVEVALFLYENEDGTYKASMRANGDVDVAQVAMHFGGGGHVKAAGCTMEGNIADIINRMVTEIGKRL